MYKLYIFVGLIAMINAQHMQLFPHEVEKTINMDKNSQSGYIKEAMKQKVGRCLTHCHNKKCGTTIGYKRRLCVSHILETCLMNCGNFANDIKNSWNQQIRASDKEKQLLCMKNCRKAHRDYERHDCYYEQCNFSVMH
jgi:hypothetical protein